MTIVRNFEDPKAFWDLVYPVLKKEEAKNSLLLGLLYNFRINPEDCLHMCAAFQNQEILGSLLVSKHKTNINMIVSPVHDIAAAGLIFNDFLKANIEPTGLISEKTTVEIYRKLIEATGKRTKIFMNQGIYRCKKVQIPKNENELVFRPAELKDKNTVGLWINDFHHEAVPHDPPIDGISVAETRIQNKMIYVLEKNNSLVAMAAWSRDIETSCSVNLVYTPKEFRNNGYASLVTAKLTELLLINGKLETNLYTDMSNPTSNRIYTKIGYEFVSHSSHIGIDF